MKSEGKEKLSIYNADIEYYAPISKVSSFMLCNIISAYFAIISTLTVKNIKTLKLDINRF